MCKMHTHLTVARFIFFTALHSDVCKRANDRGAASRRAPLLHAPLLRSHLLHARFRFTHLLPCICSTRAPRGSPRRRLDVRAPNSCGPNPSSIEPGPGSTAPNRHRSSSRSIAPKRRLVHATSAASSNARCGVSPYSRRDL